MSRNIIKVDDPVLEIKNLFVSLFLFFLLVVKFACWKINLFDLQYFERLLFDLRVLINWSVAVTARNYIIWTQNIAIIIKMNIFNHCHPSQF